MSRTGYGQVTDRSGQVVPQAQCACGQVGQVDGGTAPYAHMRARAHESSPSQTCPTCPTPQSARRKPDFNLSVTCPTFPQTCPAPQPARLNPDWNTRIAFGAPTGIPEDYAERHAIVAVEAMERWPEWSEEQVNAFADHITGPNHGEVSILTCDQRATKTWKRTANGWTKSAFPNQTFWNVRTVSVYCLDELAELLKRTGNEGGCVVRGRYLHGPWSTQPTQRLKNEQKDGTQPTFEQRVAGLRWLCVDVDDVPTDHDPRTDLEAFADDARQSLPSELAKGRCWFDVSSSAGMAPGAKVHLWFWLERPALDDALKEWAKATPHVDDSLYSAVHLHYVAPPRFVGPNPEPNGWGTVELPDILPRRNGWLDGTPEVWPSGLLDVEQWHERAEATRVARFIKARQQERKARVKAAPTKSDLERALDALQFIPADDRDDWRTVGMALHSAGGTLDVWEAWSQTSDKYVPGECDEQWAKFEKGGGVTIRSLFHLAKQNGYRPHNDPEDIFPGINAFCERVLSGSSSE